MPTTMSNISSDTHDVSQSDSFSGQSVVTDPYQQEEGDSDTATTIVHVQPQFGTNQSEWETAKNNISQYMNQMLIQSDAASKEQQRKANESRTCSGVASSLGDSVKSNEEQLAVAAALQSQASTSSTEVKNQDSSEGELFSFDGWSAWLKILQNSVPFRFIPLLPLISNQLP